MPTSNIDDLLLGGKTTQHPETPENQYLDDNNEETIDTDKEQSTDYGDNEIQEPDENRDIQELEEPTLEKEKSHTDEYGNESAPENEAIRDRLARQARKHQAEIDALREQLSQQGASQQIQKAAKDFEYQPDESGDWQQQLAQFVKQTVSSMGREETENKQRQQEQQLQYEFETKFKAGIEKFDDFSDVVSALPFEISNPMTLATRAMSDPVAFLYAAAKRQPAELERISRIRDPYAQMTEMGRLEERMRKNKSATTAPRPLSRTPEDSASIEVKKKKEATIEDMIRASDAKKLAKRKLMLRNGR